jgi:hypothetical protein
LTGRAIEKKNKWHYGREGLWPSFYMTSLNYSMILLKEKKKKPCGVQFQ